ncbi:hypothetical protein Tco_0974444 [Tanacetum coccineum]|uniref:Uncharacterized protein n=1 Tax=Tanacetum coccineum TaxID=301880 RepID=A0ABQ5EBR5_9ASTR
MHDHVRPANPSTRQENEIRIATASTGGSSASTQFGELIEHELRLKREAAERAFEAQAEKDRTLMQLEELRKGFLVIGVLLEGADVVLTLRDWHRFGEYSFKGGHSFICITDREDEALPLGRVNGARFKAMIRKELEGNKIQKLGGNYRDRLDS